jgi:hypothetical protein
MIEQLATILTIAATALTATDPELSITEWPVRTNACFKCSVDLTVSTA